MIKMAAAFIYLLILLVLTQFLLVLSRSSGCVEHDNEPKAHSDYVGVGYKVVTCVGVTYRPPTYPAICPSMLDTCTVLFWSRDTHTAHTVTSQAAALI